MLKLEGPHRHCQVQGLGPKGCWDKPDWGLTSIDSLTRQSQRLGEPYEGNVVVILLISVIAIDDDLGNRGCLRQLVQIVSTCIHLPALQDLLPGPTRDTGEHGPVTHLAEPPGSIYC